MEYMIIIIIINNESVESDDTLRHTNNHFTPTAINSISLLFLSAHGSILCYDSSVSFSVGECKIPR